MDVVTPLETTWSSYGTWNETIIVCQQFQPANHAAKGLWSDIYYYTKSRSASESLQLTLIISMSTLICAILKPIRIPLISRIIAGIIVAYAFQKANPVLLVSPPALYSLRTFSFIGFIFHIFILGVETNRSIIRNIRIRSILIGFTAMLTSMVLAFAAYAFVRKKQEIFGESSDGLLSYVGFNATTFLMVICEHLNDLGISNSELGQMVTSVAIVVDLTSMIVPIIHYDLVGPILNGGKEIWKIGIALCYYLILFAILRPLVLYIVKKTPEGEKMKQSHFLMIIMIVCIIVFIGEIIEQRLAIFPFAFSLPEEPLSSILYEKMDTMTSGLLLPFFCAMRGMQMNLMSLNRRSLGIELVLLGGYVGKFLGALISSRVVGCSLPNATAIALLLSSKGLLDIATLGVWKNIHMVDDMEYTVAMLHIIIFTGGLLPFIKYLYTPTKEFSTVKRRNVIDTHESDIFQTLVCVYKEENVPGLVRLLKIFNPSESNHVSAIALQLMQLNGRCSMPFMSPFHQVTSNSMFRSNLTRCNRIMSAFLHLERESKGSTRMQHYIAVTTYATMYIDICRLAYEKKANMAILPFHTRWNCDGSVQESSTSIRDVNKMVLEKSPCSVGIFVDKGVDSQLHISDKVVYQIGLLFVGGRDDHEALEYSLMFANHPNVKLMVLWLKNPHESHNHVIDNEVLQQFHSKCKYNDLISFKEEVVRDGAETTKAIVAVKDLFDLLIVGKHHDPSASAIVGLNVWTTMEYPELGIIGDMLVSSDFSFSLLVVQNDAQDDYDLDILNS